MRLMRLSKYIFVAIVLFAVPALAASDCGVADINKRGHKGWTPLHFAVEANDIKQARCLVKAEARLEIKEDDYGNTPLQFTGWMNRPKIARVLLGAGADIDSVDNSGRSTLYSAAGHGSPRLVRMLIKAGASLDLRNDDGWTALHHAAEHDKSDAAKILIEAGADVSARDNKGRTPLDVARLPKSVEAIILSAGGKCNVEC